MYVAPEAVCNNVKKIEQKAYGRGKQEPEARKEGELYGREWESE